MKILTIIRSQWNRGGGWEESALLNTKGRMCCLGFDALACGLSKTDIIGVTSPQRLIGLGRLVDFPEYFRARTQGPDYTNSEPVIQAIEINDDPTLADGHREALLIPLLKQIGGYDDVVFVD